MFGSQITDVESSAESNNVLRYQFHDALRRQTPKRFYDLKFSKLPSTTNSIMLLVLFEQQSWFTQTVIIKTILTKFCILFLIFIKNMAKSTRILEVMSEKNKKCVTLHCHWHCHCHTLPLPTLHCLNTLSARAHDQMCTNKEGIYERMSRACTGSNLAQIHPRKKL